MAIFWLVALLVNTLSTAYASVILDGQVDEGEWDGAHTFRDFVVTAPQTFAQPRVATEVRLLSLPEGLAVAFICEQPGEETRIAPRRARDTLQMNSDLVLASIDFEGDRTRAHEFTVSMAGAQRDGVVTNENKVSYDWDSKWYSAVAESVDGWSAEILIPWSTAPPHDSSVTRRTIAVFFSRVLEWRSEQYSWPAVRADRGRYLSGHALVDIPSWAQAELAALPYVSARGDLLADGVESSAGLDVFWKPTSGASQIAVTVNPDFGQVESDDLIVNFDAIESFFTDRRPFFTENQSVFGLRTLQDGQLLYTRRIGGPADDGSSAVSDINAAIKATGSFRGMEYGALAAEESGGAGRTFLAARALSGGPRFTVGSMITHVDRPALERSALVEAVDWRWRAPSHAFLEGMLVTTQTRQGTAQEDAWGSWVRWFYSPDVRWLSDFSLTYLQDRLDFNDLGYMPRNDLAQVYWKLSLTVPDNEPGSSTAATVWTLIASHTTNARFQRLGSFMYLSRTLEQVSGARHYTELHYDPPGYDDLISRGNGIVSLNHVLELLHYYQSPQFGRWRYRLGGWLLQEGIDGYAFEWQGDVNLQLHEDLSITARVYPRWSRDWLIWQHANRFASHPRTQVEMSLLLSWLPVVDHELRLKAQWLAIAAERGEAYFLSPEGALVRQPAAAPPFSVRDFGLQLRYRWEISPQRELYIVYGRGRFLQVEEDHARSAADTLRVATGLRDSEQVFVKLLWRM